MKLHTIDGYIQKMYLAEYPDKLLLLDGASRADIPYLKHFITHTLNRPFSALTGVIVTHMHPDHAGAAHKLRTLTGCKIISANKRDHWYGGVYGVLMHLTDLALAKWVASRLKKPNRLLWYSRKLHPDIKLSDGDVVPMFDDWVVLEVPGHTDRDLAIYHEEQGVLYAADLIVEVKSQLIAPFPVFYPELYRSSLARVFSMQPKTLLIAHGGEVQLDEPAYQHILHTAPRTPATHWSATKVKLKSLLGAVWEFGFSSRK